MGQIFPLVSSDILGLMLFNSFTYLVFLPFVVALHWILPERFRHGLLLIASYVFYMNWMPTYGTLILALTVGNYFFGLAIDRAKSQAGSLRSSGAKAWLIAASVFNLGALCFFKYANFLVSSVWQTLHWGQDLIGGLSPAATIGVPAESPVLNIILPLGISFFTFEFIHYTVDVYRGSPPVRNFWHFALFPAFFPSQIAGPIKRFQDFTAQLAHKSRFDASMFKDGCALIFLGLFKKIVLGDNLGQIVAIGFNNPLAMGTADAWLAAVGFSVQLYLDFSGYTDIGRGSAMLLGYRLPINFNFPYLAASLKDFWHRWHISLSTWLRDYLFIPLGGSRVSSAKVKRNLIITMTLGGLWHGAAWHYVIWGLFHGIGLMLTKDWMETVDRTPWLKHWRPQAWWHCSGVAITFLFVCFTFVIFRADSFAKALQIFGRMFTAAPSGAVVEAFCASTLPVTLCVYSMFLILEKFCTTPGLLHTLSAPVRFFWNGSLPARAAVYATIALVILGFAPEHATPFIYFQF
jgi:alginate O-acetyltransferase complex protein AlgI